MLIRSTLLLLLVIASGCSREVLPDNQSLITQRIASKCGAETTCEVDLNDLLPFSWDRLYVFRPGLTPGEVRKLIGLDVTFKEEFSYKYVFLSEGRVVRTEEHRIDDFDRLPDGLVLFLQTDATGKFALVEPRSRLAASINRRKAGTNYFLKCTDCSAIQQSSPQ